MVQAVNDFIDTKWTANEMLTTVPPNLSTDQRCFLNDVIYYCLKVKMIKQV